jgi:hypothetical protein
MNPESLPTFKGKKLVVEVNHPNHPLNPAMSAGATVER